MNFGKRQARMNLCLLLLLVLGSFLYFFFGNSSGSDFLWTGTEVTVTTPDGDEFTILYEEITGLEMVSDPDFGSCISGNSGYFQSWGIWENDLWGTYRLNVSNSIDSCIVITTSELTFVFNYESNATTSSLYEYLDGVAGNNAAP